MTTLQTRLAQADKPTRELLEEVYQAANGGRLFLDPGSGGFKQSYTRWLRYQHMLDAEAWTSAVEMLVPEGHRWSIDTCDGQPRSFVTPPAPYEGQPWWGNASTPALALAIACLKARGL